MVAANAFGFNGFTWPTECPTIKIKYPWSIALHWPGQLINVKVQSPSLMRLFHLPLFLFNMSLPCRFYVIQGRAKVFPAIQHHTNPGIIEIDLSKLDCLSGSATVMGDLRGSSGRVTPSSARK
jgi:hypothetical protein